MWDNTEGCLESAGYEYGLLVPIHCSCASFIALTELVSSWPVLFHGAWSDIGTSRNVRQTASVLCVHLGKISGTIKSISGRKPGWTNCCQNLSFKDILFSRALLRLCSIRIKFQWVLDCVVEQDEAFSAKLKTKNTKGTCYWGKNFFLLEPSSLEIWKILSKCKSDANMSEYRSKTGRQWVSFASFAGGHPQR